MTMYPATPPAALLVPGEPDRRTYVGGSRIAAILGVDPYGRTPLTEFLSITGELQNGMTQQDRDFLDWRREWEPVVLKRVAREFDAHILHTNQRYQDQRHEFFAAEIDAEWADSNGEVQNLEIKTVHPLAFNERGGWGEAGTGDIPVHYAAQCMWGLGVTDRNVCVVVAMAGIDQFTFYRIERDDGLIADMQQRCYEFWTQNVLQNVQPEPVNLEDTKLLMLRLRGVPIEADDELCEKLRMLNGVRESMRELKDEADELQYQIAKEVLLHWDVCADDLTPKDNAIFLRDGQEIASWNYQETTRLKTTELKKALPEVYKQYSKTTASRVLRFKKARA